MTLRFSNEVMKAMGFRAFTEGEEIAAAFTSVTVFEARGVALATGTTVVSGGTVAGVDYRLAWIFVSSNYTLILAPQTH